MTAPAAAAQSRSTSTSRQSVWITLVVALLLWMAIVAARGAILALQTFGLPVAGEALPNFAPPQMVRAAVTVYVLCLVTALLTRRIAPAATLPATLAVSGLVVLAGAIATGSFGSVLVAFILFVVIWLAGELVFRFLPSCPNVPAIRLPLAVGLGQGLLGLLWLGAATLGNLTTVAVLVGAAVIPVLALWASRFSLRDDLAQLRGWRWPTPSWFQTLIAGMMAGLVTFSLLAVFVPENQSDAIRQHLPIAREIWQTGAAPGIAPIATSFNPMQAHLFFAVAYGFGGVPAAKLMHTLAGVMAIVAVAGLAWLCAGKLAAFVAPVLFTTMPIVLWEVGHAYVDLFPVLYTVTAVICVVLWQRDGALRWLVAAGALAAFGFATKQTMIWMVAALAVGIFLVGRGPWRWRERLAAVVAFGLGGVVILPWLVRTYAIAGTIPVAGVVIEQLKRFIPAFPTLGGGTTPLAGTAPGIGELASGVSTGAPVAAPTIGPTPFDLLLVPWQLTFHGQDFHSQGAGDVGIALLMLLPLIIFVPRSRALAFLGVTVAASYIGWGLTLQITRHLLPTLAIVTVMIGAGVEGLTLAPAGLRRPLGRATRGALILGCLTAPFFFLPNWKTGLPVDLFLGRETAAEFVSRTLPSAAALLEAGDQLPADAPVGYFGMWEGPQLYTEARLFYLIGQPLGSTDAEVLQNLAQHGVEYLVWNRSESRPDDWRSVALSAPFLREHTRILAGDLNSYVFAILPDDGLTWGEKDPPQLLQDPGLEKVGRKGDTWTSEGRIKAEDGLVPLRPRSILAQQVPVTPGRAYVLTASSACTDPEAGAQLTLRWLDANGADLDEASETVIPGTEPSEQFIWRRAPQNASSVSAEVTTARGGAGATCTFDAVSLLELS